MPVTSTKRAHILRNIDADDVPRLVAINNAAVPAVSPTDGSEFPALLALSDVAVAVVAADEPKNVAGFVLAMRPGSSYDSENYRWFEGRGTDFLYVDRIVLAEESRGSGLGELLYAHVFECAEAEGRGEVTCEVNLDPPNPGSLKFHARLGFVEVGRQATKNASVFVSLLAAEVASFTRSDRHRI